MLPVIFVTFLVILFCYFFTRNDKIKLPGPKPWPFIGNVYQLSQNAWFHLNKWTKIYNGCFKFYRFGTPVVVVGSYEAIIEVLVKKGKAFSGRPYRDDQVTILGSGSYWIPGERWKLLRRMSAKHIKQFCIRLGTEQDTGNMVFDDMLQRLSSHGGEAFCPRYDVTMAVVKSTSMLVVGRETLVSEELSRQLVAVTLLGLDLCKTVGSLGELSKRKSFLLFNGEVRRKNREFRRLHQTVFKVLEEEMTENGQLENSLVKAMYDLYNHSAISLIDKSHKTTLWQEVSTLITASAITTVPIMLAFINYIGYYKQFAAKLQEEVDRVIGNRAPSVADKFNMPYMAATLFELLRYFVLSAQQYFATEDSHIGDVEIPRGTEVLINLGYMLHDESFWSDPFEFRPERFLDSSGCLLPADHEARKRLLPFGAGPNSCVGEPLAKDRLFLLMTSLVQRFEVELPESKLYCDPSDRPRSFLYHPPDFKVKMTVRSGCNPL